MSSRGSFLEELKRRKVVRVALAYAATAFVVIQAADVVLPRIPLPAWTVSLVVWLAILGFPIAVALAWVFDITTQGVQRTDADAESGVQQAAARVGLLRVTGAAAVIVAMVLAGWWLAARRAGSSVLPEAALIAIMPITPASPDSALARLGRNLVVTLSANLESVGDISVVDASSILVRFPASDHAVREADAITTAREFGARSVVYGNLTDAGEHVRLDLALLAVDDTQSLARVTVSAPARDVAAITDSVTIALLREVWRRGTPPTPNLAAMTTRSLTALAAFLDGEQAFGRFHVDSALEAYGRAIAADSSFWLAYWRYTYAQDWQGVPVDSVITARLRDHSTELPAREQMHIRVLSPDSTWSTRIRLLRELTLAFPHYYPGWFDLGDYQMHYGILLGQSPREAVASFARVNAINPDLTPAWDHPLMSLYVVLRDTALIRRGADALMRLDPARYRRLGAPLMARFASGGGFPTEESMRADVARVWRQLPDSRHWDIALDVARAGFPIEQIEVNRFPRTQDLTTPSGVWHWGDALSWAARGAWDSALVAVDRFAGAAGPSAGLYPYRLAVFGAWLGAIPVDAAVRRRPDATDALRLFPSLPDPFPSPSGVRIDLAWLDGLLALKRGDAAQFEAARKALDAAADTFSIPLLNSLEALAAVARKGPSAAGDLSALEYANVDRFGQRLLMRHPLVTAVDRLVAADALLRDRKPEDAQRLLEWLDAGLEQSIGAAGPILAMPHTLLLRARVAEALGDAPSAGRHYLDFLRIHDRPVMSLRHLNDEATARLRRVTAEPGR